MLKFSKSVKIKKKKLIYIFTVLRVSKVWVNFFWVNNLIDLVHPYDLIFHFKMPLSVLKPKLNQKGEK